MAKKNKAMESALEAAASGREYALTEQLNRATDALKKLARMQAITEQTLEASSEILCEVNDLYTG